MTMGLPTIPPDTSDLPFRSIAISITRRVLLLSLVGGIGLVSILFMGLWITLDQVQARMDKINTEAINTFDHFFLDIQSNLQATSDGLAAREDKNSELLNLHMRNSAFLDVIFINSDGTIAAQRNAVGRPKQTKIEEQMWLQSLPPFGKVVIGPVHFEGQTPYVDMAITATDDIGLPAGLLWARVDLTQLWNTTLDIKVGDNGYAYIADSTGQLVAYRNLRILETGTTLQKMVGRSPQDITMSRLSFYTGLSGEPVLASAQPLKTVPWYAIVEQPAFEALTPFLIHVLGLIIALVVIALLFYNTVHFLRSHIVLPLFTLRDSVRLMIDGQFKQNINVRYNDELGQLAQSFNQMAGQLQQAFVDLKSQIDTLNQTQAALHESERRYRLIAENTGDVIWILDLEKMRFRYVSPSVFRLRGFTVDEVLAENVNASLTPESMCDVLSGMPIRTDDYLKGVREIYVDQVAQPCKDGSVVWTETVTRYMTDEDSGHLIVLGVSRNISERKRAEENLRISENYYRTLMEQAADGIFIADSKGKYVDVNSQGCMMTGYSQEEMMRLYISDLVEPEEVKAFPLRLPEINTGNSVLSERRLRRKDGTIFLAEISGKQLADGRYLGMIRDITERKRYEENLRISEQQFRSLFEQAAVGVAMTDAQSGEFLKINQRFCEILGYTAEEMKGITFQGITHPDDVQISLDKMRFLLAGTIREFSLEKRYLRKDGGEVWVAVSVSSLWEPSENPTGYVTIVQDITGRKQTEEALVESQALTVAIVDSTTDLIWSVDPDHFGLLTFNQSMQVHFLKSRSINISIGMRPEDLFPSVEFIHYWRKCYQQTLEEGAFTTEYQVYAGTITLQLTFNLLKRDDKIFGISVFGKDITEHKAKEKGLLEEKALLAQKVEERTADLRLANAELLHAAQIKDEFLASMSHELRTPLTGILGISEALQLKIYGELNQKQVESIQNIGKSGAHLLSLINDILDLSKIGAGMIQLEPKPVSIRDICRASIQMIRQVSREKRIKINLDIDEKLDYLIADERRMKQILVNLLSNAVKFTPEDGDIGLEVRGDSDHQCVHFIVWDHGIGIHPQDLNRLFKPFTQLDSALSRQYAGTGLGLSLMLKMVELHGGGVEVESEPGRGSRFIVTLPWQGVQNQEMSVENSHSIDLPEIEANTIRPMILIVEDNLLYLNLLTDVLSHSGYHVITALNGEEGIETAREKLPQLILMDIQMPILDGLQATRRIRSYPELGRTPIIALTALAMSGDREKCFEAGMNDYLSKPVNIEELKRTMDRLMNKI